jgi:hypothetical protein
MVRRVRAGCSIDHAQRLLYSAEAISADQPFPAQYPPKPVCNLKRLFAGKKRAHGQPKAHVPC